jgi:diacylglycerol kinase (CTP)
MQVMQQMLNLKNKSDLHMIRKIWHAAGVTLMAFIYQVAGHEKSWIILGISALLIIPYDVLRKNNSKLNDFTLRVLGPVMRSHEATNLSGLSYLLMGGIILMLFGDKHIVTLTVLFLAFGDPSASFFGIRYGKDKIIGNKSLQGTMGAFGVCTLTAAVYYYNQNLMTERLLIVAPLSGAVGAIAELFPVGKLDDNLTFPIISGVLLWVLFNLFGGFGV